MKTYEELQELYIYIYMQCSCRQIGEFANIWKWFQKQLRIYIYETHIEPYGTCSGLYGSLLCKSLPYVQGGGSGGWWSRLVSGLSLRPFIKAYPFAIKMLIQKKTPKGLATLTQLSNFKPYLLPLCIHFNTAVERRVYHMAGQGLASENTMHDLQCLCRQREHHVYTLLISETNWSPPPARACTSSESHMYIYSQSESRRTVGSYWRTLAFVHLWDLENRFSSPPSGI